MIIWVLAGLLALATGVRIGWTLVNRQSVVSSAMILALGGLTVLAALNWPPLTRLVDTGFGRTNAAIGLSLVALIVAAAGSLVMITSVVSDRRGAATRRRAAVQYGVAAVVGAVSLVLFLTAEPEPAIRNFADRNFGSGPGWLGPLLYAICAMSLVSWLGIRLSSPTRRGRALFLFSTGMALIVSTAGVLLVGAASLSAPLLTSALAVVAAGALLPTFEDWLGSHRELRLIEPLQGELERRHDVGIGVRPRGPLVFRVAEKLSAISDALYLEAGDAESGRAPDSDPDPAPDPDPVARARAIARWIAEGPEDPAAFPGRDWLGQPAGYSDRDWILEIARRYRELGSRPSGS